MRLPPLLRLAMDLFTWRRFVFNRFVLIAVAVLVASGGVAAYVGANDGGVVEGQVVDADGDPMTNVTVTLSDIPLNGVVDTQRTRTDANGEFVFRNQTQLLEYRLQATTDEGTIASESGYNYFRGQNVSVVLEADSG